MTVASPHRFFRPIIFLFFACVVVQLATGALLYFWKIGFDPARTIEYYFGSERMLELFPGSRDRFIQARSFAGMVKISMGHFVGYGVLVFFLTHLARSLSGRPSRNLERACAIFFILALFEIFAGMIILAIPPGWLAVAPAALSVARAAAFFAFYGFCLAFLVAIARSGKNPAAPGGHGAGHRNSSPVARGAAVLLVFSFFSCQSIATGYSIESYEGKNESVVRMSNNYLGGSFALPGTLALYSAQLNLQRTKLNPDGPDAREVVSFYGRFFDLDYLKIPAGATLTLIIDGRELAPLSGQGSAKLRRPYSENGGESIVQEAAYWHEVPESLLIELYRAQTVRVRIRGAQRELALFATDKNRSNFRRFIRDELPRIHAIATQ